MKKILFVIGLVIMTLASKAQHKSIGITAGTGTAWMSNVDDDGDVAYKPSTNIGITYVYSTDNHWAFGADVKYSREGVRVNYDDDANIRINSDFIRVPLRAIYFFNDYGHNIRPKVSLGPTFGFMTGGKVKFDDGDGNEFESDVKDDFKGFDFGIQGALGANFKVTEDMWFGADIAYYHGVLKQNENGSDDVMNRNLTLNLALTMGIGK